MEKDHAHGEVIQGIVDAARETDADLVVMSTDGRNGFLDALRGSHTERVLQQRTRAAARRAEGSTAKKRLNLASGLEPA
jgi:hypothetical protein